MSSPPRSAKFFRVLSLGIGVVVLVAVLAFLGCLIRKSGFRKQTGLPSEMAERFVSALRAGDWAAAQRETGPLSQPDLEKAAEALRLVGGHCMASRTNAHHSFNLGTDNFGFSEYSDIDWDYLEGGARTHTVSVHVDEKWRPRITGFSIDGEQFIP
jgi:hypothetical protein